MRNTRWALPLPYVAVPTTSARSWSCSAPATISLADADPLSVSTTSGTSPTAAAPDRRTRDSRPRSALRRHDRLPRVEEQIRDADALVEQPARIPAQIEHERARAGRAQRVDRLAEIGRGRRC
jgi:hypothetical protein